MWGYGNTLRRSSVRVLYVVGAGVFYPSGLSGVLLGRVHAVDDSAIWHIYARSY